MNKKLILYLIISIGIIIIAVLPRSIEVINGNYVFGYDQGNNWLAAKSIIIDHKFPLIGSVTGGLGNFFQGPGWFYLLAIPFLLFQGDPYGAIVLMFTMSVGIVILFLYLFYSRLGRKDTLSAGFFLSMAPILISNSRLVWPPFVIPFLTIFYLFFVYRILENKYSDVFLLFLVIGVMEHFEIATAGPLFIATFVLFTIWSLKKQISVKYLGLGLVGSIIPLLPLMIFDFRHEFLNLKGMLATLKGAESSIGSWEEYMKIVSNHWMIFSDEFFRAFQMIFVPKIYMAGFIIAGSVAMVFDKKIPLIKRQFVGFLFILPVLLFFVFFGYKNNLWAWWISELTVVYAVLAGILCVYAWQKGLGMRMVIMVLIGLMVASYIKSTVNSYKKELADYGGVHKVKGKKDALDVIYRDAQGERFGILIFTPPIYTYPYDYLLSWYGNKQYGYIPPYEKKELFYLLIEPDYEKPWRHNGWIETVIKDGIIEKTWNLPSGFIIEKRRLSL